MLQASGLCKNRGFLLASTEEKVSSNIMLVYFCDYKANNCVQSYFSYIYNEFTELWAHFGSVGLGFLLRIAYNCFHSDCKACFCLKCFWKFFSLTLFLDFWVFFLAAPTVFLRVCLPFKFVKRTQNLNEICHSDIKLSTEKPPKVAYVLSGISGFLSSLWRYIVCILNWGCVGKWSIFQFRCPWIWSQIRI